MIRLGINAKKTCVIPNAIDASFFKHRENNILAKDPDKVRILVLSRMTYRKGMDLLLEIMPTLCKKFPHVEFLICGDGNKKLLIKAIVQEYGLEKQVKMLGFLGIS